MEAIVSQLLEKQRTARMTGSLDCSDPDSTCLDNKSCIHQVMITPTQPYRKTNCKLHIKTENQIKFLNSRSNLSTSLFQAVKTESPSTTPVRGRGGRGSMMHHRHGTMGENNNQVLSTLLQSSIQLIYSFFVPKVF